MLDLKVLCDAVGLSSGSKRFLISLMIKSGFVLIQSETKTIISLSLCTKALGETSRNLESESLRTRT